MDQDLPSIDRLLLSTFRGPYPLRSKRDVISGQSPPGETAPPQASSGGSRKWYRVTIAIGLLLLAVPWLVLQRMCLLFDDFWFPDYKRLELKTPLFIVGPPRSGTTLLHRLVAADRQQFTTTSLIELVLAPAIWQKMLLRQISRLDRKLNDPIRKTVKWIEKKLAGPEQVHPTSLFDPEEDYLALLPFRACFLMVLAFPYAESIWRLARFDDQIGEQQRRQVTREYRRLIQRHCYVFGTGKSYLCKNPSFCSWLNSLQEEFPEAKFLGVVRRPSSTLPSQLSSIKQGMAGFGYSVQEPWIVQQFTLLYQDYYREFVRFFRESANTTAAWVGYDHLRNDPKPTLTAALNQLSFQISDESEEVLEQQSGRSQGYQSGHRYSFEEFGIDPELFAEIERHYHELVDGTNW